MTVRVIVPIEEASLERARAEALVRGQTVEMYLADIIEARLPPRPHPVRGDVSSIFGLVQEGEPTDIARDKDELIGEAAWQEYLDETKQK
jgi:hypothetical protein